MGINHSLQRWAKGAEPQLHSTVLAVGRTQIIHLQVPLSKREVDRSWKCKMWCTYGGLGNTSQLTLMQSYTDGFAFSNLLKLLFKSCVWSSPSIQIYSHSMSEMPCTAWQQSQCAYVIKAPFRAVLPALTNRPVSQIFWFTISERWHVSLVHPQAGTCWHSPRKPSSSTMMV